jgi:hypothetical protein
MNPLISLTESAVSTATKDARAVAVIEAVRAGRWREPVEHIRTEYQRAGKDAVDELKKRLPGILWSGKFERRCNAGLMAHSGLLCADLDNCGERLADVRAALLASPHLYALFLSPTATGMKAVFRVPADATLHARSFAAVQAHVRELCGLDIDAACKDVARLCFVSYDPEAFLNRDAVELPPLAESPKSKKAPSSVPPGNGTLPPSVDRLLASGAQDGERNTKALWLACQLRDAGRGHAEVENLLLQYGARCTPPLASADELRELKATARSAFAKPPRDPARSTDPVRLKIGGVAREYLDADGTDKTATADLPAAIPWPGPMHAVAFRGLAGELVRTIDPHTEANPAAVLILFLAAFGNMAGTSAHFLAEARQHPLRIWPVLVGETAKSRKGSAWSSLRFVLEKVDPLWLTKCTTSGLSTGEGLIWSVRDPIVTTKHNKDGTTEEHIEVDGVKDKRIFFMEEEFSAVLKVAAREQNTISDTLRRAWDHGDLATHTKNSKARATGAHVTVAGHITKPELARQLSETDSLNGFGNRFLWLAVRRSKLLPEGGALATADVGDLVLNLRRALDHVRTATLFERTPAAREFWRDLYPVLTADRPGLLGAITNRAEAYAMRLAVAYAALDLSRMVDVPHIQSALAVWDYCLHSAAFIFGESLGDRVADRILDALRAASTDGVPQSEIFRLFGNNILVSRLAESLGLLERLNLAKRVAQPHTGKGRPPVVWQGVPYERNEENEQSRPASAIPSFDSFLSLGCQANKAELPTWSGGSPITEPPDDLPPVDADGNRITPDEETVTV